MKPKRGRGKYSDTDNIEDLKKKLRQAQTKGDFKEAANLHNQLGHSYRLIEHYEEALEHHEEEAKLSKSQKDKMGLGIAYRNKGETYLDMKEEDLAVPFIKNYLRLAKEECNKVEEQRAYITLGRTFLCLADKTMDDETAGDADSISKRKEHLRNAEGYFRKGLVILDEHELTTTVKERDLMEMKCGAYQNLGVVFDIQGNLYETIESLTKAVDIGSRFGFHDYMHPCYTLLSTAYLKKEKPKEARKAAQQALKSAKALNNVSMEVESLLQEARTLFYMNEVDIGKKLLKKLRKRVISKISVNRFLEEVERLLSAAIRISRSQDSLFSADRDDYKKRLELHECLGDNYAELSNFSEAINEYLNSVNCALMISSGSQKDMNKKISRLYYSIAVSYTDKKDYINALKYFDKEMGYHNNNPVESFKTQTNITSTLEKLERSEEELVEAHNKAVQLAKKANSVKREATALQNLALYYKSINKTTNYLEAMEKVEQIKDDNNLSDLEETEADSQDLLDEDEIDFENLSSDEDSEVDEDDTDQRRNEVSGKPKKSGRKNELGETGLHIAAKKGDLKAVRRLMRQGHDVNPRDTAGWIPLHEACNFGHYGVVEELLKHKAWVNDPGGEYCDKLTPLHDAASNGHFEIIQLLVENGADVLARDKCKNYPLDLLISCMQRAKQDGENLSDAISQSYKETKQLLKSLMIKAGRPYEKQDEVRARKNARARSISPKFSLIKPKGQESCSPTPVTIANDDYDPDNVDAAVDLYSAAMNGLLRRKKRKSRKNDDHEDQRSRSASPQDALISETYNVQDDWLLNDVAGDNNKAPKRKRDPMDDVVLQDRTTRRRKPGQRNEVMRRENIDSIDAREANVIEDMDFEVERDVDLPKFDEYPVAGPSRSCNIFSSPTSDNSGSNSTDGFQLQFQNDDDEVRPTASSHRHATYRDDEEDDEDVGTGSWYRRQSKSSLVKPRTVILDSDDEDFQNTSTIPKRSSISSLNKLARKGNARVIQTKLPFTNISSSIASSSHRSSSPPFKRTISSSSFRSSGQERPRGKISDVLRLKIRVLDQVLLVPVDEDHLNETIDWLCQECSIRYLKNHGVKPILTLSTKDGAMLSGTDSISLVLGSSETELEASVTHFDLPPLPERFKTACIELGISIESDVIGALNMCQSTNVLNVTDFYLRGKLGRALFQSLQRQYSLRDLILCGCSLFDEGIKELSKILSTLPNLSVLDLSSNGMTRMGFQQLVESFCKTSESAHQFNPPLAILTLNISHNPLRNSVALGLSNLIGQLCQLKILSMADCDFTERLFDGNGTELCVTLRKCKLEEVDISYNVWGETGMNKFLQALNPTRLKSLDCTSCGIADGETFAKVVSNFLSRNEDCCLLKDLKLSDCSLNDQSVQTISEQLFRLVSLESLTFCNHNSITLASVANVLEKCVEHRIPLTKLDVGCCPGLWENSGMNFDKMLLTLEKKLQSEKKLNVLRMTLERNINNDDDDDAYDNLSSYESRVASLYEDYSGNTTFDCKRDGNCIIFELQR